MAQTLEKKKSGISYWIIVLVGLFLMFGFGKVCPTWAEVTPMGVTIVGIFIGLLTLVIGTGSMGWPCLMALFAAVLFGYMSAADVFAGFLGTSTIAQMLAYLAICEALRASGAGEVIAKFIITRKIVQGRPVLFTFAVFLAFFLAGIFIPPTGGIIFSYSVFESVREVLGYDRKSDYFRLGLVGLYVSCMLGVYTLPFKTMSTVVINTFLSNLGVEGFVFNNGMYIVTAFFIGIVFLFIYALSMRYVFRCDVTPIVSFDITKMDGFEREKIKFNKVQIIYFVAFLIGIGYSLVMMVVPKDASWYEKANSIGSALWMLFVIAALGIVRVDGKNIFSVEKNLRDGTMWGIIIAAGVLSILGNGLADAELGIRGWLFSILGPVLSNVSWPVFVFLCVLLATGITNFFSNMVTGIIVATIAAPFAVTYIEMGIDVSAAVIAIALAIQVAYLTYAAYTAAPLLLGHEGMDNKFIWTKGLYAVFLFIILTTVVLSIAGYVF